MNGDRDHDWMTDSLPCRVSANRGEDLWFSPYPMLQRRARIGCSACPQWTMCAQWAADSGIKWTYCTLAGVSFGPTGGVHPGLTPEVLAGIVRDRRELGRARSRGAKGPIEAPKMSDDNESEVA